MPRKKDPTKQTSRRSHHGCQRCRSHKIRCDEVRPTCGPCRSRGYTDCTFSLVLKWETDYVGRAFGRAGVWSKNSGLSPGKGSPRTPDGETHSRSLDRWDGLRPPHVYPYGFLNMFINDFQEGRQDALDETNTFVLVRGNESNPVFDDSLFESDDDSLDLVKRRPSDPFWMNLENVEPHLFSYLLHQVCPLTVPSASYASESPFSALILPFALSSSQALTQALIGLAASHRARFDESYRTTALRYSRKALRSLRSSLSSKTPLEISADPAILPLMMMLCQIELIRDGGSSWVVHLRGARDFICFRRQHQHLLLDSQSSSRSCYDDAETKMSRFTERFFAFYDVMGRTACGEEPIFGNDFWSNQEDQVDLWMGCSPRLVNIISTITELSWRFHNRTPSDAEREALEDKRIQLHALLQQQDGWMSGNSAENDIIIQECVELKRLTVELYLHAALADTTPLTPTIRESVKKIITLIATLLSCGVKSGLTWPLFMAACQLDPSQELELEIDSDSSDDMPHHARPFVLYALDQISDTLSNVSRTRAVIEQVWKRREGTNTFSDEPKAPNSTPFNDWARFVAPLCHNISLA